MRKRKIKNLNLSKTVIAKIDDSIQQKLKGGTETISKDYTGQMTQCPDEATICEAHQ